MLVDAIELAALSNNAAVKTLRYAIRFTFAIEEQA